MSSLHNSCCSPRSYWPPQQATCQSATINGRASTVLKSNIARCCDARQSLRGLYCLRMHVRMFSLAYPADGVLHARYACFGPHMTLTRTEVCFSMPPDMPRAVICTSAGDCFSPADIDCRRSCAHVTELEQDVSSCGQSTNTQCHQRQGVLTAVYSLEPNARLAYLTLPAHNFRFEQAKDDRHVLHRLQSPDHRRVCNVRIANRHKAR